jgi:general secretion pathway protein G
MPLGYVTPETNRLGRRRARERFFGSVKSTCISIALGLLVLGVVLLAMNLVAGRWRADAARRNAAAAQLVSLSDALAQFEADCGAYPSSEDGLGALRAKPLWARNWAGPYVEEEALMDPWGRAFVYRYPGDANPGGFDLVSTGPDGVEGTSDDVAADVLFSAPAQEGAPVVDQK